jgi:hypothetical protein
VIGGPEDIGRHFRSPNASIEVREFLSMPGMS